DLAIDRAAAVGLAAVAVRGSNHCGAMAYFATRALSRDMIGWATTNALPTMAPWGGTERIVGINPLAIAIPAGEEFPIVYDAAFSGSSHGKIRIYRQQGKTLPVGWALNRDGEPTIDPSEAMDGLLMPIGGYKGTALAMIMGILSTMLSGASYGTELGDMASGPRPGQDGHFFLALRIEAFENVDRFKSRVDHAIRQVHDGRPIRGVEKIFVAGEREKQTRAYNLEHGIPLNSVVLSDLRRTVGELDLAIREFDQLAVGSA
ncbi:MAG TPA: Ldh family oxidoreductase, partial [Chloroflexota bacterium]|nr:Ldh family oxidoreductase [Chloroflexota bacterium]